MKTLPSALQTHLDSGATTLCWCWRLTGRHGAVLGFTDHDVALTFDGTTFEPDTGLTRSAIQHAADLSADAQDVQGALRSDRLAEADLQQGLWDGAAIEVFRVNYTDTDQRVLIRYGSLGEVRRGRVAFVAEMRGLTHLLNVPLGRTVQRSCDTDLGSARCTVDLTDPAFNGSGAVATPLTDRSFTKTGLGAFADGLFAFGILSWATGQNTGRDAPVLLHVNDGTTVTLTLIAAPLYAVEASDTFTIVAGYDKSPEVCDGTFGNIVNFQGFPHVQPESAVLRYARTGENDGSVL